ncbi:MAG: hypothetical protein H7067_08525 [Burkholderiales bacterium]|nr:hypothetical protein [Opitutaceae bacterium]
MKTKIQTVLWSLLLTSGVMLTSTVRAEEGTAEKKPRQERPEGGQRPEGGPRGGGGIEQMKERLGLTDEQVEKLKPILAAQREEVQAARKELGEDADRAVVREKMNAVREKYQPQIAAILTEEQKAKWAKAQERRQGGPGGPGGPDGPAGGGRPVKKDRPVGAGAPPPPHKSE